MAHRIRTTESKRSLKTADGSATSSGTSRSAMSAVRSKIGKLDGDHESLPEVFKSLNGIGVSSRVPRELNAGMVKLVMTVTISFALVAAASCACMFAVMEAILAKLIAARPEMKSDELISEILNMAHVSGVGVSCAMVTMFAFVGYWLGKVASSQLLHAASILERCRTFGKGSQELDTMRYASQSCFREIEALYHGIFNIASCVETFSYFLPDTVVSNIMSGCSQSRRLHVTKRDVSIMFSDIEGFTTICERLQPNDLLFFLTRYLSVMTKIAECFSGVVTEILGDGLLVYWNASDDVEMHASKACGAAITMQQALRFLENEFTSWIGVSELNIRIGLNTGRVFCGTLGSITKMKFGCIGDPVNLTSRLEGLCKLYGVGIICSDATRSAAEHDLFQFRKLDLVVAKGKQESTIIHQLIGFSMSDDDPSMPRIQKSASRFTMYSALIHKGQRDEFLSTLTTCNLPVQEDDLILSNEYEAALAAFQAGRFVEASKLASNLLEKYPDDTATKRLSERSKAFIGVDGSITISDEELAQWSGVAVMLNKGIDEAIGSQETNLTGNEWTSEALSGFRM